MAVTLFGTFTYKRPGGLYNVSLDGGAPSQYFLDQNSLEVTPDETALYDASNLSDGRHTLFFTNFQNNKEFGFDYAIITPGANASWVSDSAEDYIQTASSFVNASDPMISYNGSWKKGVGGFLASATMGDSLSFSFSGMPFFPTPHRSLFISCTALGSHIAVSGLWQPSLSGSLSLGFSLDGGPLDIIPYDFDETTDKILSFYNASYPSGGTHNISIQISQASGLREFLFAGLFYSPDFTSLNTMPDLPLPSLQSSPSASPATPSIRTAEPHAKSRMPIIAGATAGAAVLLLLVLTVVLIFWRQRIRRRQNEFESPFSQYLCHEEFSLELIINFIISPVRKELRGRCYWGGRRTIGEVERHIRREHLKPKRSP